MEQEKEEMETCTIDFVVTFVVTLKSPLTYCDNKGITIYIRGESCFLLSIYHNIVIG
jgi:hypothetical protein